MASQAIRDIELLALEIDTLWTRDGAARLVRERGLERREAPLAAIAASPDGMTLVAAGAAAPDRLGAAIADWLRAGASTSMADFFAERRADIESLAGPVTISDGPSYAAESLTPAGGAHVLGSFTPERLASLQPPERGNWTEEEWRLLCAGAIGPWAAAMANDAIVSICFCARLGERGAEAGVWTDPDHRRRGHAAAVTAAWAREVAAEGKVPFYSTSSANVASQRVARRLGLRAIGALWQIKPRG